MVPRGIIHTTNSKSLLAVVQTKKYRFFIWRLIILTCMLMWMRLRINSVFNFHNVLQCVITKKVAVTFTEKPVLEIYNFLKGNHGYLIHSWLDKTFFFLCLIFNILAFLIFHLFYPIRWNLVLNVNCSSHWRPKLLSWLQFECQNPLN